jgi:hypothetical protein
MHQFYIALQESVELAGVGVGGLYSDHAYGVLVPNDFFSEEVVRGLEREFGCRARYFEYGCETCVTLDSQYVHELVGGEFVPIFSSRLDMGNLREINIEPVAPKIKKLADRLNVSKSPSRNPDSNI